MKLRILSIQNPGQPICEHVVLEVLEDTDIGKYILFNTCSTKIIHSFWFPDLRVKKNDLIYLYTEIIPAIEKIPMCHYLTWNLQAAIWTNFRESAVLVEASDWHFKDINKAA